MQASDLATLCQDTAWNLREVPPQGIDALAETLHHLREAKRALGDAERDIEAQLAEEMGDAKEAIVAGLGRLERKAAPYKPRWDHEALLPRIAALSRDERRIDEQTGELLETDAEAAIRVFLDCAAVSYFRRTKLRERGLDPNQFCENEGWRTTVRIIPAETTSPEASRPGDVG